MNPDGIQNPSLVTARRFLWLYCILWLAEGAIRKWVLPSYSIQLLLVRDPVVLLIYYYAARAHVFPVNGWLGFFWVVSAVISVQGIIQVASGDVSWMVAAFGIRIFVLHLPLIWVVPALFGRKEIVSLGKWVLYLAPFFAVLMVVQFEVGTDHWLNVGTLKGGGQIGSVFGKIRPPAVFSFISGPIHYYTLCAAFIMAGFLTKGLFPRWLLVVGMVSTLIAMSVSASRSLVLGCFLVGAVGGMTAFRSGKGVGALLGVGVVLIVALVGLSAFDILKEGVAAFTERWTSEEDSGSTGGRVMTQRVGGGFASAFDWAGRVPIGGLGVGLSSNLATEKKEFISPVEGEWERVIYEVGPITGFLYLGFRAAFALALIFYGIQALRTGDNVCLILASACFFDLLSGNVRQVTSCGYISVTCGLCVAASRAFSTNRAEEDIVQMESLVLEKPKLRGRGRFSVGGNPVQP